ncbi:MAG: DUF2695 domain-containing protein [Pseudonocardia sp.]
MSNYFDDPGRIGRPYGLPERSDELEDDAFWDDDPRGRTAPLTILLAQQAALAATISASVQERGCDNTLRSAQEWAAREGVGWAGFQAQLEDHGGYCDCEVLLNVLPSDEPEPD